MPVRFRQPAPLARRELVEAAEVELGVGIPDAYVALLTEVSNGGGVQLNALAGEAEIGVSVRGFYGVGRSDDWDLVAAWLSSRGDVPAWFLPIGEDSFSNRIGLSVRSSDAGSVWFWDHEAEAGDAITNVAPDLGNFLSRLQEPDVEDPQVISVWVDPDFTPEFDD